MDEQHINQQLEDLRSQLTNVNVKLDSVITALQGSISKPNEPGLLAEHIVCKGLNGEHTTRIAKCEDRLNEIDKDRLRVSVIVGTLSAVGTIVLQYGFNFLK